MMEVFLVTYIIVGFIMSIGYLYTDYEWIYTVMKKPEDLFTQCGICGILILLTTIGWPIIVYRLLNNNQSS